MRHSIPSYVAVIVIVAFFLIALVSSFFFVASNDSAVSAVPATNEIGVSSIESSIALLNSRIIIDSAIREDEVVLYVYLGERVPEKITPDEDITLRTEYSFTRYLGSEGEGEERVSNMEARTFPQKVFHKTEAGEWFYLEHATTSLLMWENRKISFLDRMRDLMIPFAYADTVYGFTGDGTITGTGNGGDNNGTTCRTNAWSNAQVGGTAQNGLIFHEVATSMVTDSNETPPPNFLCTATIARAFLPFPTDNIPSRAHITGASLNIYIQSVSNTEDDGNDFLTVWQTSQNTHTTLVNDDYNDFLGEIIDSGDRKDLTTVASSAYLAIPLNGAGFQAIKKQGEISPCSATTGITCIGVREGHDALDDRPVDGNSVQFSASEATGVSQDPYLSVAYTVPDSIRLRGGVLQVRGGNVRLW